MVRDYELMYIVRPDLDEEGVAGAMQSVQTLIEGQGGEVVRTTPWGKRRLAYEIERMRDGHYVLLHIRLDGNKVRAVEQLLHIHDNVFRHLITVWVDSKGKDEEGHVEPEPVASGERELVSSDGGRAGADAEDEVTDEDAYPGAEEDE